MLGMLSSGTALPQRYNHVRIQLFDRMAGKPTPTGSLRSLIAALNSHSLQTTTDAPLPLKHDAVRA